MNGPLLASNSLQHNVRSEALKESDREKGMGGLGAKRALHCQPDAPLAQATLWCLHADCTAITSIILASIPQVLFASTLTAVVGRSLICRTLSHGQLN